VTKQTNGLLHDGNCADDGGGGDGFIYAASVYTSRSSRLADDQQASYFCWAIVYRYAYHNDVAK